MRFAKFENFNPSTNTDKVYSLYMMEGPNGTFSVFADYGRRGSRQRTHIQAEDVDLLTAEREFSKAKRTRLQHGYLQVA
jgi:hypothetical protein